MTIRLTPAIEEKLVREANRLGLDPEAFARQVIEEKLSTADRGHPNQAILEMLDQWDREDQTDDPAEIARRQQDFEEFKQAVNSSHTSDRKIYP